METYREIRDTKLIFRQARVRNTRKEIRELTAYFVDFDAHDFPGRITTQDHLRKKERFKFLGLLLRELELDLIKYRIRRRRKAK